MKNKAICRRLLRCARLIPLVFFLVHCRNDINILSSPFFDDELFIGAKEGLRLRNRPGAAGAVVGLMAYGDKVHRLEEKDKTEIIDGVPGKWARVFWNKQDGWAFGGFLQKTDPLQRPKAKRGAPRKSGELLLIEAVRHKVPDTITYFYDFNVNGDPAREYTSQGQKTFYYHNPDGKLIESISFLWDNETIWSRNHFKYAAHGELALSRKHHYWTTGEFDKYPEEWDEEYVERRYAADGNLIEEIDYAKRETLTYEYAEGKPVKVDKLMRWKTPEEKRTFLAYAYDGRGSLIRQTGSYGTVEYAYNDGGQLLEEKSGGYVTTYAYDAVTGKKVHEETHYPNYDYGRYVDCIYDGLTLKEMRVTYDRGGFIQEKYNDDGTLRFRADSDGSYKYYSYRRGKVAEMREYYHTGKPLLAENQENLMGEPVIATTYRYVTAAEYVEALNRRDGF